MTDDLDDSEIRQLVKEISGSLAEHGPPGQALATAMMERADGKPIMQIAVAIVLIQCFLKDRVESPQSVQVLLNTIHGFVRHQMATNLGTPQ